MPVVSHLSYLSNERPSLYLGLSLLDLSHNPVDVLQLLAPIPEDLAVLLHLFGSLALHFLRDGVDLVSAVFLVQTDELVEVALCPVGEALE